MVLKNLFLYNYPTGVNSHSLLTVSIVKWWYILPIPLIQKGNTRREAAELGSETFAYNFERTIFHVGT